MDPRHHARQLAAEAARTDRDTWCEARVPFDGTNLDGAVVELQLHDDGIFTASVRIPGPPRPVTMARWTIPRVAHCDGGA